MATYVVAGGYVIGKVPQGGGMKRSAVVFDRAQIENLFRIKTDLAVDEYDGLYHNASHPSCNDVVGAMTEYRSLNHGRFWVDYTEL